MPFPRSRGAFRLLCLCLALTCLGAVSARATEDAVSVAIEACGAMAPQSGEGDVPRPARMVRPDGNVLPGDAGLGCRFTVRGGQRGKPVVVEARLSRPALTGQGQALDRWYVLARRGEIAVAEHVFPERGQALAGTWTLELFIAGRLVAEKPFQVKTALGETAPVEPVPQAATEQVVAMVAPPALPSTPVPDLGAARAQARQPQLPAEEPLPKSGSRAKAAKTTPPAAAAARPRPANPNPKTAITPGPARPVSQPQPPAPRATGYFALQTGVFAEADNARGQAAKLRTRGYPACVAEEKGPDGKRYRVLAGRFGDRHTAMSLRGEVATAAGGAKAVPLAVDSATASRLHCQ